VNDDRLADDVRATGWSGGALHPGALTGLKVLDLSRQAPGPYCSMLLADFGAEVLLVEPPDGSTRGRATNIYWELERDPSVSAFAALRRNKYSICLDLKDPDDRQIMGRLVEDADVLIEGFRPGAAERLGISAEQCAVRNPSLVYCSITGFGQVGPLAQAAGHDINYLATSGVLEAIADEDGRPVVPLNLLADFGGGGLMAAFAIMVALVHRNRTGEGQSIDLSMLDGTFSLLTHAASLNLARGADLRAGRFFLSGLLPQYSTYRCSDGRYFAVGALEPWFYERLMSLTGRPDLADAHSEPDRSDGVRDHLTRWFAARDSQQVEADLGDAEVCVNRVNSFAEGLEVAAERGMLAQAEDGVPQMGVAPRLSQTPGRARGRAPEPGRDRAAVLAALHANGPVERHTPVGRSSSG